MHCGARRSPIPNPVMLPTALTQLGRSPGHVAPQRSSAPSPHPASVLVATVTGKSVCFAGWEGVADRTRVMRAVNETALAGGRALAQSSAAPHCRADPCRLRALANLHGADKMTRCKYARLLRSNFYSSSALCTFLLQRG